MTQDKALNSPARLAALRSTHLLDSSQDADFDRLTRLASQLLRVPSALVTLVSADRQYVKSASNSDDGEGDYEPGSSQTLDMSFCKHAVASAEPFIVEDAREHPLVRESPAVQAGVVAYAGIHLEVHGEPIGALCVIDSRPRKWSEEEVDTLRVLARSATRLLEERSSGGEPADPLASSEDGEGFLPLLTSHLASLNRYETVIGHPSVDFEEEMKVRDEVESSFQRLANSASGSEWAADPELAELVRDYVTAEQTRSEATKKFAAGEMNLAELDSLISIISDATTKLRLAAIDRGAVV